MCLPIPTCISAYAVVNSLLLFQERVSSQPLQRQWSSSLLLQGEQYSFYSIFNMVSVHIQQECDYQSQDCNNHNKNHFTVPYMDMQTLLLLDC